MNLHLDELPPVVGPKEWVAIDVEIFTQPGDLDHLHRPHTGKFACLQIAIDEDVYVLTREEQVQPALDAIDAATWVIHNGKFDLTHLRRWANVPPRKKYYDTMYMEKILWNGYYIHFSLAAIVRRYLGIYMEKETRETFEGSTTLNREQIEYAALDAYYTLKAAKVQRRLLQPNHIKVWTEIDRPALWAFLDFKGFAIDVDRWTNLGVEHKRLQDEIDARLPFNPRSPKQIKEFLANARVKVKSTEAEELEKALEGDLDEQVADIIRDVLDSKMYATRASRYGLAFIENFLKQDAGVNVIVGDYQLIGAECLPAGELALTQRGYLPVEDVCVGDKVITHRGRARQVTDSGAVGVRPITVVRLSNGLSLKTSSNHPYLRYDGQWIEASQLKIGELVVVHSSREVWATISGWEDFEVSSWGRIRNRKTQHCLSLQKKNIWGHLKVMLVRNNARTRGKDRRDFSVHRLVADAFIPNPNGMREVRHLNGIAWDNTVENLAWGTRQDNIEDALRHGSMSHRKGSQAKLNQDAVDVIRFTQFVRGNSDYALARQFGVSREIVRDVRLNKRWTEENYDEKLVTFHTASVMSIEQGGMEMVYGLSIDEDHSHVTGGIVTHNTGRTACKNPNMQNIPARDTSVFRECFIARPGHKLIIADFASQEPFISAVVSGEPKLLEWIAAKKDIYSEVAREVFGKTISKKDPERDHMKSIFLGGNYGMSKYGLARKLGCTADEAQRLIDRTHKVLPVYARYMEQQRQATGKVCTPFGREIHLNPYSSQSERNALNAPIQGGAGDQMKAGLGYLHQSWEAQFFIDFPVVGYIHDELVSDVPEEYAPEAEEFIKTTLETVATKMVNGVVQFRVDTHIGNTWADKKG